VSGRSNADVAAVFAEMGELMLIAGGDPYRARAFSRAAQVIAGLREPLAELLSYGRLEKMAGIGAGSVERIKHVLRSGTCPDHQRLLARVPVGLRDVIKVRGMGPRTARLAFEQLRVMDLKSLEAAARSGALTRVSGIGPATTERVLAHLDELAAGPAKRLLLSEALFIGDRIVAWLKDDPSCTDALQTGSARRRQELIGDLDFVAGARDAGAVAKRFTSYPDVREVLSGGDGFVIVILKSGVQADLRIVDPECFGAGVHHFTGNKQHNISLRLRAHGLGLHVSEKGVWERKLRGKGRGDANRKVARRLTSGRTEAEVFAAVGLAFIPVELRTGGEEIDQAARGALPVLVQAEQLRGDLHLACADAESAIALASTALARGLQWGGFVVDQEVLAEEGGALIVQALRAFERQHAGAFTVFIVARARIDSQGGVILAPRAAARAQLVCAEPPAGSIDRSVDEVTAAVERAVSSGAIDVLCRPMGRTLPDDASARADVWRVLRACALHGVVVEAGGDPRLLDLDAAGCRAARELGARLSIASRASMPAQLADARYALWQARRGGVGADLVVSTRTAAQLLQHARSRGRAVGVAERGPAASVLSSSLASSLRGPIDDALRARLERFLRGEPDAALERALLEDHPSALQGAFAVLSRDR
jgi:DNA polymerase (family X)